MLAVWLNTNNIALFAHINSYSYVEPGQYWDSTELGGGVV